MPEPSDSRKKEIYRYGLICWDERRGEHNCGARSVIYRITCGPGQMDTFAELDKHKFSIAEYQLYNYAVIVCGSDCGQRFTCCVRKRCVCEFNIFGSLGMEFHTIHETLLRMKSTCGCKRSLSLRKSPPAGYAQAQRFENQMDARRDVEL